MKFPRILTVLTLAFAAACTSEAKPEAKKTPITPEIMAKLAKADAKDGTVDKIVHKCAGCSLGMDGKAEHSIKVEDYTMHLCSPDCLARYQMDAGKELSALQIKD